jgi:serine/threonine-protein kinase
VKLGKYELVRKLATGGMAEVFLAKARGPRGFEKTVVIKRILRHLAEDEQFVQMFLSEAQLAAKLNHARIVQIFDFGEAEGDYFIAMEHIDGPNLRALAQQSADRHTPLSLAVVARMMSYACEGLAYAHELCDPESGEWLRLVHRDISPDNILLARSGDLKLVDFGIAKAVSQVHRTSTGLVKGKLAYMSPEQLSNKPLDLRADVYALGVVAYELISGARPFTADSDVLLMQAVMYQPHTPITEVRPDVPEALQRLVDRALAKDRDERYESCREMQHDLEEYLGGVGQSVGSFELAALVGGRVSRVEGFRAKTPSPKAPVLPVVESPAPPMAAVPTLVLPPKVDPVQAPLQRTPSTPAAQLVGSTQTPAPIHPPPPPVASPRRRITLTPIRWVLAAGGVATLIASGVVAAAIAARSGETATAAVGTVSTPVAPKRAAPSPTEPPSSDPAPLEQVAPARVEAPTPPKPISRPSAAQPSARPQRRSVTPASGVAARPMTPADVEVALQASCSGGETLCDDECVKLATNAAHCGSCRRACNSNQLCVGGACKLRCDAGRVDCGGGACVDLTSDLQHCGACNAACPRYLLPSRCVKGSCQ